jgi:uncharacterized Fe-S center protein
MMNVELSKKLTQMLMESYDKGVADAMAAAEKAIEKAVDVAIATEREACAKVCEQEVCACCWEDDAQAAAEHLAERIRARGQA